MSHTIAHRGNEALTPDIWGIEAELVGVVDGEDDCAFTMFNKKKSWKKSRRGAIRDMTVDVERSMTEVDNEFLLQRI
jgi:hypothetical protein